MWQEIAVYLIGASIIAYIGKKIYTLLVHPSSSPCGGCSDCPLKNKCKTGLPKATDKTDGLREASPFKRPI